MIPVPMKNPLLGLHPFEQGRSRIRRHDMKRRRLDALSAAHSTVRLKTLSSSPSIPKTKLPLIITPLS